MMLIRRLLPLLLLTNLVPGQEDRLSEREAEMERRIKARAERGGEHDEKGQPSEKEEAEDLGNLTPEERLARTVRSNASAFCRFVPAVKPAKLMPGQTGTLVISVLFNGQAVLPSPAPMELMGSPKQGVVTLGGLSIQPAEPGRHAAAYLGRPVYDNYAILEIPVTVAPDAAIGTKQAVGIDLRFDIYDGSSAQPIGRFVDRVAAEIEIGRVLDPVVVGLATSAPAAAATGAAQPVAGEAEVAGRPGAGTVSPERVIGAQTEPIAALEPAVRDAEPAVPTAVDPDWSNLQHPDDSPVPLPIWIGGGILLLALVLLLARRK
jgi:hypothetical protein